eukprot:1943638-Rhodomonas_salina.1
MPTEVFRGRNSSLGRLPGALGPQFKTFFDGTPTSLIGELSQSESRQLVSQLPVRAASSKLPDPAQIVPNSDSTSTVGMPGRNSYPVRSLGTVGRSSYDIPFYPVPQVGGGEWVSATSAAGHPPSCYDYSHTM